MRPRLEAFLEVLADRQEHLIVREASPMEKEPETEMAVAAPSCVRWQMVRDVSPPAASQAA